MANLYDELGQLLEPDQTTQDPPGFRSVKDTDGTVLYYEPIPGYVPQNREGVAGTSLDQSEIPIPRVSLPDVPKENAPAEKTAPVYDVTPEETVTKTPSEQLTELEKPVEPDPWETAAARVRRRGGGARPQPETPPPEETPPRDFAEGATAPLRFGAAAVGKGVASMVYGLPAAAAELGALIEENIPKGESDLPSEGYMQAAADWLREAEKSTKAGVEKVTGTAGQKPVTPLEKGLYWTGEYLMPAKGVTAGATVGLAGAGALLRGALTKFGPEDVPGVVTPAQAQGYLPNTFGAPGTQQQPVQPTQKPQSKPVPVSPAPGAPKAPAPVPPGSLIIPPMENKPFVPPAPGVVPEKKTKQTKAEKEGKPKKERAGTSAPLIPDGMIIPPPDQRKTAKPNLQPIKNRKGEIIESQDAFNQRVENAWVGREIKVRTYTPTAQETFKTIAGLDFMSPTEYKVMGAVLGTFVGSLLFSVLRKKYTKVELPIHRSVETAAPGTAAISVPSDLARAYDDINAPLARIARRAGIDPTVVNRLMQTFRIQTRNGARALADSAIAEGAIETPAFRFNAPASLREMGQNATPETDRYLKLLAEKDALVSTRNEAVNKAAEGFRTGRLGEKAAYEQRAATAPTTQKINDVEQAIKDMEAANPDLTKMGEANRGWNNAMTDFRASGEYATLTKEQADALRMSQTNRLGGKATDDAIEGQATEARKLIKQRLDNEAVGKYVDEMRKADESLFVPITKEQLDANPAWANNVVKFMRGGQMEYYTTDRLIADVIKADHHQITGNLNIMYSTKRMLEATTTGNLAPQFAPTSAIRSYWIAKFTTDAGFSAPGAIGSILAIPQQLIPQLSRSLSRAVENGMGGLVDFYMTPEAKEGLVRRLAAVFDESLFAKMKAAGGSHRGAFIEQQQSNNAKAINWAQQQWDNATANSNVAAGAGHFWNAWKASLEAIHNAPAFAFARKNLEREGLPELALRARRLTGDPRTGGEFYTGAGQARQAIKFESNNTFDQAVADTLVKAYGWTTEFAKNAVPWWNPTLQGAKRIGEAYLDNPVRFHMAAAQLMALETGLFYYNKALGLDPNGKSYFDHYMFGRSSYANQMNFGIGIPGRPVEDMVEFPYFHELNPLRHGIRIALHHMLGRNMPKDDQLSFLMGLPPEGDNVTARNSVQHDLWNAAWNFIETAVVPPMPPPINAALGWFGIRGPQGVFGGEARPVKGDPFNQNGGLPQSLEIMTRALWGGVAEAFGTFVANATQSEGGIVNAVKNGALGVGELVAKRTPLVRNILDILPDRSNNTDMAQEIFDHQKYFNEMDRFYQKWEIKNGQINVNLASKSGNIAVHEQYGLPEQTPGNPGLDQRLPDNPVYLEFMKEFHNRFMKESPTAVKGEDQGGVAFKSLWRHYGVSTQKIERLKNVNFGTYDRWQREMDPEERTDLEENGVDPTNRRDVVNYYRRMQQDALRQINYVRRSTEYLLSQRATAAARANDPNAPEVNIRLKDLKPYLSTMDNATNSAQQMYKQLLDMSDFMFPDLQKELQ